ncbi:MAG: hypothetical protein IPK58_00570 [Acidobacteria bacterium]|nr:hypothetical protein [Acidobacteriota bacterium]
MKRTVNQYRLGIESFGVRISVETNDPGALRPIRDAVFEALPGCVRETLNDESEHRFVFFRDEFGDFSVFKDRETVIESADRVRALVYLVSRIRTTAAEFAVDRVILHSGVVSWNGKAILFPGESFSGKTSLTAEFVRRGAVYYSDEYAVLDGAGRVHPFPKTLSMRGIIDDYQQVEHSAEAIGGRSATESAVVGAVIFTAFSKSGHWEPAPITQGEAMLELIKHTLPIRTSTEFSLTVLKLIASNAMLLKSDRGEATATAPSIIEYLDPRFRTAHRS